MEWYWTLLIILGSIFVWILLSALFYKQFFKRFYDIVLSGLAIVVLSPLFLVMIVVGAIAMRGNPFFTQQRPGKNEKIFKLIKFRSMDNRKDESGNLLPDEVRLNKYGKFIRKTSLDELPELFNIFVGNMSIIGPRPLVVRYLPWYNSEERHRHDIRPGLSGWAQVNGRTALRWDLRFKYDIEYVNNVSLQFDIKIVFLTVLRLFKKTSYVEAGKQGNFDDFRKSQIEAMGKKKV